MPRRCYGDSDSDNEDDYDDKVLRSIEIRRLAFEKQLLKQAVAECKAADAKTADVSKAARKKRKPSYSSGLYFAFFFNDESYSE